MLDLFRFVHTLIYSIIHLFIYLYLRSINDSFVYLFAHSFITCSFRHSFVYASVCVCNPLLIQVFGPLLMFAFIHLLTLSLRERLVVPLAAAEVMARLSPHQGALTGLGLFFPLLI